MLEVTSPVAEAQHGLSVAAWYQGSAMRRCVCWGDIVHVALISGLQMIGTIYLYISICICQKSTAIVKQPYCHLLPTNLLTKPLESTSASVVNDASLSVTGQWTRHWQAQCPPPQAASRCTFPACMRSRFPHSFRCCCGAIPCSTGSAPSTMSSAWASLQSSVRRWAHAIMLLLPHFSANRLHFWHPLLGHRHH